MIEVYQRRTTMIDREGGRREGGYRESRERREEREKMMKQLKEKRRRG